MGLSSFIGGLVINYHYDGNSIRVLYETDSSDNLTKLYTYSASGILLSMTKFGTQAETYYYHYNAHGDVVKLTAQDGTEVANYIYDAWGNILNKDEIVEGSIAYQNPYRYAGYRYDKETELYYVITRYYDAETGRFISKDPVPNPVNDYVYAGNNPINYVDPNGENESAIWVTAGGLALIDGLLPIGDLLAAGLIIGYEVYIIYNWIKDKPERGPASWPDRLTEENLPDEYVPPKDGIRKGTRNGKTGFIDKDGNIWVEPKGNGRHGKPHWDVQTKKGKHKNAPAKL